MSRFLNYAGMLFLAVVLAVLFGACVGYSIAGCQACQQAAPAAPVEGPPFLMIDGERYDRGADGVYRLQKQIDQPPLPEQTPTPKAEPKPPVIGGGEDEKPDEKKKPDMPTGVDESKLRQLGDGDSPIYWEKGKKIEKPQAYKLISKGSLVDDRKKPHVTLIGSAEDRKKAFADMPADLKGRVKITSCGADDWRVKGMGYVTTGKPTIYVQAPSGKVLWRQDVYSGPTDWSNIRKAVDGYDGKNDPGPNQSGLPAIPPIAWVGGGAALLFMMTRKKKAAGAK